MDLTVSRKEVRRVGKKLIMENDCCSREINLQAMKVSRRVIRRVDLLRRSLSVSFLGCDERGLTFTRVNIMS